MRPRIQHFQCLEGVSVPRTTFAQSARFVHSSSSRHVSATPVPSTAQAHVPSELLSSPPTPVRMSHVPLARLPTPMVLRSYLIGRMSSSPALLSLCFTILRRMLDSKSYLTSVERNPLLRTLLQSTFYAQFCAGETKTQVQKSADELRTLGYDGIMLEYALEMLSDDPTREVSEEETAREIQIWRQGMLDTIEIAQEGDCVGLKWSGLGTKAFRLLQSQSDPTPAMWEAMVAACDAAAAKNIALLPGAEEEITNIGLEKWNLALQKKYNTPEQGRAIVYTTYQCYLRDIGDRIAQHLEIARKEGYIAGVKLVRGAYLATEPKELTFDTIEGTHANYDGITAAVLNHTYNDTLRKPADVSSSTDFPAANLVLATHNYNTIKSAQAIRSKQRATLPAGQHLPRLTFIQLKGMADEISQELVQSKEMKADKDAAAVKCMTWGTATQCLNFLLRRAAENKEAALRVEDTRRAMGQELWRRWRTAFGLN